MKKHTILVILLLSGFIGFSQNVVFVNHEAAGSNDGTSWADAYTDLSVALENAQSGNKIWIAAGTYLPGKGSGDSTSTFYISTDISILGGFSGTETSSTQRDRDANPVIFSGDHLGNDGPPVDLSLRTDNSWHVVTVDTGSTLPIMISDVYIQNGSAFGNSGLNNNGGGILAMGRVNVSNCVFNSNGANGGGAMSLPGPAASESFIRNSEFSQNYSASQGACIFTNLTNDVFIGGCTFSDNIVNRGVIYPLRSVNTQIFECYFNDNSCEFIDAFGGALFNWNSMGTKVSNCEFNDNICGNGGASYVDGREFPANVYSVEWSDCQFNENRATDWGGGAIYAWRASQTFFNCSFSGQSAPNTGGALYLGGNDKYVRFEACEFEDNVANGGWGGAHAIYGDSTIASIEDCFYSGNSSITSGGAVTHGFKANANYINCEFEANTASFGGAAYVQNDSTQVSFESCSFFGNTATDFGGGINISGAADHSVIDCEFELNVSDNSGGALAVSDPDATDAEQTNMLVMRSVFQENISQDQAAAIYVSDVQMDIVSSKIVDNSCLALGIGGAISHNASSVDSCILRITNSTIANNIGAFSDGISSWVESDTSTARVILLNSILHHVGGADWRVEQGNPTLISMGGNLVSDNILAGNMTGDQDVVGGNPGFIDAIDGDYHLEDASICVNTGLSAQAPGLDLDGNMRVGEADKGAYENQNTVANKNLSKTQLEMTLAPNPLVDQGTLSLEMPKSDHVVLRLYSSDGKLVLVQHHHLSAGVNTIPLIVSDWQTGHYSLELVSKEMYGRKQLIKI